MHKVLGVIGESGSALGSVVRLSRWSQYESLVALMEQRSSLVAHCVCHAFINGVERVIFGDCDTEDVGDFRKVLQSVLLEGVDCLVIPGFLSDVSLLVLQEIIEGSDVEVLLDVRSDMGVDEIIAFQRSLVLGIHVVWPWASVFSPGRRSEEFIGGSCLCGALALGCCQQLRGMSSVVDLRVDVLESLMEAGVYCLQMGGKRGLISLFRGDKLKGEGKLGSGGLEVLGDGVKFVGEEGVLAAKLLGEIEARCRLLFDGSSNGRRLWGKLERAADSVLYDAKSKGLIKGYHVRCDEETASWGDAEHPVIEVILDFQKRVRGISFRVGSY